MTAGNVLFYSTDGDDDLGEMARLDTVAEVRRPEVVFDERHVDANGIEGVPTPGHTPGSTCFLVPRAGGLAYLFTGDTSYRGADGRWRAGYLPFGDADAGARCFA